MASSRKDNCACRETQDRSLCLPGAEATAGTFNIEILTNSWGQSGDNQERMKFLGAIVRAGSTPLVSFFSRNPTRLSQGRWWKIWRRLSQWCCLGLCCSVSWLPYWKKKRKKASPAREGYLVRALV